MHIRKFQESSAPPLGTTNLACVGVCLAYLCRRFPSMFSSIFSFYVWVALFSVASVALALRALAPLPFGRLSRRLYFRSLVADYKVKANAVL